MGAGGQGRPQARVAHGAAQKEVPRRAPRTGRPAVSTAPAEGLRSLQSCGLVPRGWEHWL